MKMPEKAKSMPRYASLTGSSRWLPGQSQPSTSDETTMHTRMTLSNHGCHTMCAQPRRTGEPQSKMPSDRSPCSVGSDGSGIRLDSAGFASLS